MSTERPLSKFDQFDGYYSVRFSGVEFARFAPSSIWSDYARSMQDVDDFSYAFIPLGEQDDA